MERGRAGRWWSWYKGGHSIYEQITDHGKSRSAAREHNACGAYHPDQRSRQLPECSARATRRVKRLLLSIAHHHHPPTNPCSCQPSLPTSPTILGLETTVNLSSRVLPPHTQTTTILTLRRPALKPDAIAGVVPSASPLFTFSDHCHSPPSCQVAVGKDEPGLSGHSGGRGECPQSIGRSKLMLELRRGAAAAQAHRGAQYWTDYDAIPKLGQYARPVQLLLWRHGGPARRTDGQGLCTHHSRDPRMAVYAGRASGAQ